MDEQKVENVLNLAFHMADGQREKSGDLNVGYDPADKTWELIVKYSGSLDELLAAGISVVYLLNNYAILTVPQGAVELVAQLPQIEYIEMPKRLFFADSAGLRASCITPVQSGPAGLTGRGVIIGLVDSGLDYTHPDFRNADGTTRLLALWDQTAASGQADSLGEPFRLPGGKFWTKGPPAGYTRGVLYPQEVINAALSLNENAADLVPSVDYSGHGTAVMGIAAGNGRQGGAAFRGVAYESDMIVVKLGNPDADGFPRTTELMQGINYIIEEGVRRNRPVVINVSFGNNYGSHDGTSLLENYINDVAGVGRCLIVIGTGNEGAASGHTAGRLTAGETREVPLAVGEYQPSINIQLWKNFVDVVDVEIIAPSGRRSGFISERLGTVDFTLENTRVLVYYGQPNHYSMAQEVYIELIPVDTYVDFGVWTILLQPRKLVDGTYEMWLPGGSVRNAGTRFLYGTPYLTLTIPSTASRAVSVGAYDAAATVMADFSGRGSDSGCAPVGGCMLKPDLVAPGVNLSTTAAGGGYTFVTGTSFATPFVSGSAALLMEWGIVRGNSPYLYGEMLKAYLVAGAVPMPGFERYPNAVTGYGRLCLQNSLNRLL